MKKNLWALAAWRVKPPKFTAQPTKNDTHLFRLGSISRRADDSDFDQLHAVVVGSKRSENRIPQKGLPSGFCKENGASNAPTDLVLKKR
ncbi:unnamed protein product [Phytomonas sp. EM1]|nr:unnamed protein product [Phytomonas sp. EM1]|eukprot:CCW63306.1 unnamed protein product [Phytomonas sp. isolate EM1]